MTIFGFYEAPKVLVFLIGAIFIAGYIRFYRRKELGKFWQTTDWLFWGWLIILSIASYWGVHPAESFFGGSYRHQGVIFFLGMWLVGKFIELLPPKLKQFLVLGFLPVVCLESLMVIAQKIFNFNLVNNRPLGTFGEPNAVAGFLAIGAYLAIKGLKEIKLNKIIWPFVVLALLAIFLTGSRSGLLSLLFIVVYMTPLSGVKPIIILGVLVLSLFILKNGLSVRNDSIFENRLVFWRMAVAGIKTKPLLGYGAESGEYFYNLAYAKAEMPLYQLIVDRSHNLFLDVALWSGLVGLTLFVIWFMVSWKNSYGLIAWLIFASLQPLGVVHWILLVLLFKL